MEQSNFNNHYWTSALSFRKYNHARVLPFNGVLGFGGVCDSNGVFVDDTALEEGTYNGKYKYDEAKVIFKHKTAIFIGAWNGIYGHAITDNIKKLWFLFSDNYKKLMDDESCDLIYTFIGKNVPSYIEDIISSLGLDFNMFIRVKNVIEYDNIIVPDNSIINKEGKKWFSDEYHSLIKKIIRNCVSTCKTEFDKVFFSRSALSGKKDFGEKAIEAVFQNNGFYIVHPEKLSFSHQVAILNSCSLFASTEGSVSHNSLFLREGIEVIFLKKANYENPYQSMINAMKKHNVLYISANHTIQSRGIPWWEGPFFLWKTISVR